MWPKYLLPSERIWEEPDRPGLIPGFVNKNAGLLLVAAWSPQTSPLPWRVPRAGVWPCDFPRSGGPVSVTLRTDDVRNALNEWLGKDGVVTQMGRPSGQLWQRGGESTEQFKWPLLLSFWSGLSCKLYGYEGSLRARFSEPFLTCCCYWGGVFVACSCDRSLPVEAKACHMPGDTAPGAGMWLRGCWCRFLGAVLRRWAAGWRTSGAEADVRRMHSAVLFLLCLFW